MKLFTTKIEVNGVESPNFGLQKCLRGKNWLLGIQPIYNAAKILKKQNPNQVPKMMTKIIR